MELVCDHLCGWAAPGTRENYREHTITMGQEEPGTTKPRQPTEPALHGHTFVGVAECLRTERCIFQLTSKEIRAQVPVSILERGCL